MASRWRATLVLVGGAIVHICLGTVYTFGNVSPYLTSYIRKHSSPSNLRYEQSVWIYALAFAGQGSSMYFGHAVEKYLGSRGATLLGSWIQSFGILLTYYTVQHSFVGTILSYGLILGLGVGLTYAIPLSVGMRWFPNRKGLVNGCILAGFGGGAVIFDQIQTAYINPHNKLPDVTVNGEKYFSEEDVLEKVPSMFLLYGGLCAFLQLIGALLLANPPTSQVSYQPLQCVEEKTGKAVTASGDTETGKHYSAGNAMEDRDLSPKELLKQPGFYMLWFIFLLCGQGIVFVSSLYKAFGQTFIADDVFLTWVGTFAAVCNASGRIFWGSLADRFGVTITMMYQLCLFTVLMLTLSVTSVGGRWMFLIWVGLLFLAFSGSFVLMPTAVARSFGQTHVIKNYGLVFTSQIITGIAGALLTSFFKSSLSWPGMFFLVAFFSFVGFVLSAFYNVKRSDGSDV